MEIIQIAEQNFERHIRQNRYSGRGLVVGRSSAENAWLMIYWIMGRSENSRNRRFMAEGGSLRTEPVDTSKVTDPGLIIYEAMLELRGIYLASNGDQTRTLVKALRAGGTFEAALATREREPDAPNYTPRISAMLNLKSRPVELALSILKANPTDPALTDRFTYRPAPPPPGLGYCLTTYISDGNPPPSFSGEPLLLPCMTSAEAALDLYWNALDAENRVSLAVKRIHTDGGPGKLFVCNRFGN